MKESNEFNGHSLKLFSHFIPQDHLYRVRGQGFVYPENYLFSASEKFPQTQGP